MSFEERKFETTSTTTVETTSTTTVESTTTTIEFVMPEPPKGLKVYAIYNVMRIIVNEPSDEKRSEIIEKFLRRLGATEKTDDRILYFKESLRKLEEFEQRQKVPR